VSWAAHELESYVLQRHLRVRMSYSAVLVGCLLPDLFTKLPVYGLQVGELVTLKAADPARYHRGWPGVGFTHSLLFGVVVALIVLAVTRSRAGALGLLVGQWAHSLTDTSDSVGVQLLFPFSLQHYSTGMWAYAGGTGRYGDAAAYYSSLGGVWDAAWLLAVVGSAAVLSGRYLVAAVEATDPAWTWIRRRFAPSPLVARAIYRAFFVYGACRIAAWFLWARLLNPERGEQVLDLSWGGPSWVEPISFPASDLAVLARTTAVGLAGVAGALALLWWAAGRRLWRRAA
jgi:membrane-bound metal-dependent hydrolase YbcI (DUF457 family)